MYGLPELVAAKEAFWEAVRTELTRTGDSDAPEKLDFSQPIVPRAFPPEILFTQLCGFPMQKLFPQDVLVLGAPVYEAENCDGATHCGVFVVQRGAAFRSLQDLRGTRFVFGGPLSNSGMNLPRRALAELADGAPFFRSAVETESQVRNLESVAKDEADATCVDTVTYAYLVRHREEVAARLRVLATTPGSPSIPFVTSAATDAATVDHLRGALQRVATSPEWTGVRSGLLLSDIVPAEADDYKCVLDYEREAVELGYPVLC
jgi:ABC-type phosphate/phosphonate transport system substrate-binding protein